MAAAIVGIGLFTVPIEKAQAQVLSPSHITGVTLYAAESSDYELTHGIVGIEVDIDVFDTSAIVDPEDTYAVHSFWPGRYYYLIDDFGDSSTRTESYWYFDPLPAGNYYHVKFFVKDSEEDCIEVIIWVGADGSVSAMGYDSDGNSYSVDVTVEWP